MNKTYLLDLNVVTALTSDEHESYLTANSWFDSLRHDEWALCPLTEAGYVRLVTNPAAHFGGKSILRATEVLADLATRSGYSFWPINDSWAVLTRPFANRIFGHQQVTDAYLLGLAIKHDGVLVTFDKAVRFLAGPQFEKHVLVLA